VLVDDKNGPSLNKIMTDSRIEVFLNVHILVVCSLAHFIELHIVVVFLVPRCDVRYDFFGS
jgi:hypothetical protein